MIPRLSAVIVAYGKAAELEACLASLRAQGFEGLEVIVVDNAPREGAHERLMRIHPQLRYLASSTNLGYAGGCNLGLEAARGEFVLFLNPDTQPAPGALEGLVRVGILHPDALFNPLLIGPDGRVNTCGLDMHYTGITSCRGLGTDADDYHGVPPVPLVSGAALFARRAVFGVLGGFDPKFFMYLEDAELSLRARSLGHPLLCATEVRISHAYDLGMSPRKFYYLERNRLLMLFQTLGWRTLLRLLPALLLTELATWSFALLRGPRYLAARFEGYAWILRNRAAIRARRASLGAHTVPDPVVLADTKEALPFDQLVESPRLAALLTALVRPSYHILAPAWERIHPKEI